MKMTRIAVIAASGLGLAACTSSLPSLDFFSSKPATTTLTIESDPPGADARLSTGGTCRTPCTQTVPVANEFTVSYSLNGYTPQSVSVKPTSASPEGGSGTALLDPNPVFAQLQAVSPPKPPPKKKKRPRQPAATAPTQGLAPAQQGLAPTSQGGFAPPTNTFTPAPGTLR